MSLPPDALTASLRVLSSHRRALLSVLIMLLAFGASPLAPEAKTSGAAQEKLMKIPARLARMGDYLEAKSSHRSFSFDFIYDRVITL